MVTTIGVGELSALLTSGLEMSLSLTANVLRFRQIDDAGVSADDAGPSASQPSPGNRL